LVPWGGALAIAVAAIVLAQQPDLMGYILPTRFTLDANHALLAGGVFVVGIVALLGEVGLHRPTQAARRRLTRTLIWLLATLAAAALSGLLMLLKAPGLDGLTRASYTAFDVSLALVLVGAIVIALRRAIRPQAALAHEES
jgi:hypothetical protein